MLFFSPGCRVSILGDSPLPEVVSAGTAAQPILPVFNAPLHSTIQADPVANPVFLSLDYGLSDLYGRATSASYFNLYARKDRNRAHLLYRSDEWCSLHDCYGQNLVYRSSDDAYATPHFLTRDADGSQIYTALPIEQDDGTLKIYTDEYDDVNSLAVLRARSYTPGSDTLGAASDVFSIDWNYAFWGVTAARDRDGVTWIAYGSMEYCAAHACASWGIALRNSADGFASRIDIAPARLVAGCNLYNAALHIKRGAGPAVDKVYVSWQESGAGCANGDNVVAYVNNVTGWNVPTIIPPANFGGYQVVPATLREAGDGKVYLFGVWFSGVMCNGGTAGSTVSTFYASSADAFAAGHTIGCQAGWEGVTGNMVDVDPAGNVVIGRNFSDTYNYGDLSTRTSADGFAVATPMNLPATSRKYGSANFAILANGKAQLIGHPVWYERDPSKVFTPDTGTAGANVLKYIDPKARVTADAFNRVWVQVNSPRYCDANGCDRLNLEVYPIDLATSAVGAYETITRFTSSAIQLAEAWTFSTSANTRVTLYNSNEEVSNNSNASYRSNADGNLSRTAISANAAAAGTFKISDVAMDSTGKLHAAFDRNRTSTTGDYAYAASSNWAAQTSIMPSGYSGPMVAVDATQAGNAIVWAHNPGAPSWGVNYRQLEEGFAALHYADMNTGQAYTKRKFLYNPLDHSLTLFYLKDPGGGTQQFWMRTSADGFATETLKFSIMSWDHYTPWDVVYDSTGKLHFLAVSTNNVNWRNNIEYRNSDNWATQRMITNVPNSSVSLAIQGLYPTADGKIAVCYSTQYQVLCNKF